MSEYVTIEYYVNSVMREITKHEVDQVSERLRALGWEEVVRCRDCRFAYPLFDEEGDEIPNMLDCHGKLTSSWDDYNDEPQDNPVEPDGFCAWGERRDDAE